jgi:hypothetical protein
MTAEVALRASAPSRMAVPDKIRYAQALAESGLLPAQYRRQPANLLYAIEYAEMLGAHPLTAVTGIFVIDGKPSASAALISALVRRAGHKLRVTGDAKSATAQIIRADDPDFTFEVTFTMDDAKAAKLAGKSVWQQYPASMLKARAITQVARDACEDALSGLHYTAEELGAEVDEEGVPTHAQLVKDLTTSETPAERGPLAADPWALPAPLPETDIAWFGRWQERLDRARTEGECRGLWSEMVEQHRIGKLTDADRATAEDLFRDAAAAIKSGERAVADAKAATDAEQQTLDTEAVPA